MQLHGGKNWKQVAEYFEGRTDVQCLHRWQKVLNPDLVKGPWTPDVSLSEQIEGLRDACEALPSASFVETAGCAASLQQHVCRSKVRCGRIRECLS